MGEDKAASGGRSQRQQEPASSAPPIGGRAPRSRPALDKDVQVQIGQQLRAVYDDVLRQEVPDRFMKLLAELDARTGAPLPRADEPDEGEEKQ